MERLESLNISTIEVNRPFTKQLLNNFLGQFFRNAETIFGARVKHGLFIYKKGVHLNTSKCASVTVDNWYMIH